MHTRTSFISPSAHHLPPPPFLSSSSSLSSSILNQLIEQVSIVRDHIFQSERQCLAEDIRTNDYVFQIDPCLSFFPFVSFLRFIRLILLISGQRRRRTFSFWYIPPVYLGMFYHVCSRIQSSWGFKFDYFLVDSYIEFFLHYGTSEALIIYNLSYKVENKKELFILSSSNIELHWERRSIRH